MATGTEVLEMLLPQGGWIITGNDWSGVQFIDERPKCTETQYTTGFAQYDNWKIEQAEANATVKAALLARLGIAADEAKLLLG